VRNVIIVHPLFDGTWPFVANHLHDLWPDSELIRLAPVETRTLEHLIQHPESVTRLISLMAPLDAKSLEAFTSLKETVLYTDPYGKQPEENCLELLKRNNVKVYKHASEGYWGQSVAEFALALTLCALRRIPQGYKAMMTSLEPWNYEPENGIGQVEQRGVQYANFMGADVAAWDSYAAESSFHRAGSRRVRYLEQLLEDADIFAPMLPLTPTTRGLITAKHIRALPKGCLVVLVTRATICDFAAVKKRVLEDELSLAADVFEIEPVPLDDPLIGRHNVVHTPHMAGRTKEANFSFATSLLDMFLP
jgi:phosphoglycerate dehydrogenase-like enzyme